MQNIEKSPERLKVIARIRELESEGKFDVDVEDDPPAPELLPEDIEYPKRGLKNALRSFVAFRLAYSFFRRQTRKKNIILDSIINAEALKKIEGGVIVTCNHFSPFDSFVMQKVFDKSKRRGRLYRVIREGNYTAFPGFYGFLMRNCNTLPLSQNSKTMKKFLRGIDGILKGGDAVLIYPEQSMWYNYRKPKPHKIGAYQLAVRSDVPILPCFITLTDSEYTDKDGFPTQKYTVHVGEPIYPDTALPYRDRASKMLDEGFEYNKRVYEEFYGTKLVYEKKND